MMVFIIFVAIWEYVDMWGKFGNEEDGISMIECMFALSICAVMCVGVVVAKGDSQFFTHVDSVVSSSVDNK